MVTKPLPPIKVYDGGLSPYQLRQKVKAGEITKLASKLYVWGKPAPLQALRLLCADGGSHYASGRTLFELLTDKPVTYPLAVASVGRNLGDSPFITATRYSVMSAMTNQERAAHRFI